MWSNITIFSFLPRWGNCGKLREKKRKKENIINIVKIIAIKKNQLKKNKLMSGHWDRILLSCILSAIGNAIFSAGLMPHQRWVFWENHTNFQISCRLYCEILVRVVASSLTGVCINPAFWMSLLWLQKNLLFPRGKRVCGVKSWRRGMTLQGGCISRNYVCQCHRFDLSVFFLAALPAPLPVSRTAICLCMGHWAPELVLLLLTLIYHHKCL